MTAPIEIPGYKIIRQLGRGGMATVYLAMQALVEREVALKVMAPQLGADPSFGERFLREARIAARLRHPHIVAVIEVGVHGDLHYAAMEYLSGGPILQRDGDSLSLGAALRAVREIALALDYAHAKGVVHRDVKPDNIFLREDGSAVLGDFGIARAVDASGAVTRTGAVVGTPIYMSPEQLRGKLVDGRSDLYSLGVVFHQLLLGRPPYVADDALALGIMHMTSPLPQLPPGLAQAQAILSRLLAKEPDDRFQNGAEVAHAVRRLEAELSGEGQAPTERLRALEEPPLVDDDPVLGSAEGLDMDRGRRPEPSIGQMDEAVSERWRVTPRPPGRLARRRRRWWLPLLLVALLAGAAWQWREHWWPPLEAQIGQWLQLQEPRLAEYERLRDAGQLLRADGQDALAQLQTLLSEQPAHPQALGALAAIWPQLLQDWRDLLQRDPAAAERLRLRLLALRPQAADELQPPAPPVDIATADPPPDNAAADQRRAQARTALAAARRAERELRWYGEDGALPLYVSALALDPELEGVADGLARLVDRILIDAREALQRRRDPAAARAAVSAFAEIPAASTARSELQRLLAQAERRSAGADRGQRIASALSAAERILARPRASDADVLQAGEQLTEAQALDPGDARLREVVDKLVAMLLLRAGERIEVGDRERAEALLERVRALAPNSAQLRELQVRIQPEPAD